MIEFHCPHCDKLLRTPDEKAGVRANCPGCGELVTVPESSASAAISDPPNDFPDHSGAAASSSTAGASRTLGAARAGTIPCPMCGEQITRGSARCSFCGEEVRPVRHAGGGRTPHRGVLILIFGILGWVICFPFGIAAWVMANGDLREMNEGRMDEEGRGLTIAGKVLGIVQCCLVALAAVFIAIGLIAQN